MNREDAARQYIQKRKDFQPIFDRFVLMYPKDKFGYDAVMPAIRNSAEPCILVWFSLRDPGQRAKSTWVITEFEGYQVKSYDNHQYGLMSGEWACTTEVDK